MSTKKNNKTETLSVKKLNKDEEFLQQLMQFANFQHLIKRNLNERAPTNTFNKSFTKKDVTDWLANPSRYEKQLRDLSRFLLNSSSHYRRIIDYFASMLTFDYVVNLYDLSKYDLTDKDKSDIKKRYIDVVNYLETMNLKHEFSKLIYRAWVDDVVYGYEYSGKNSYFIDVLNPDYCAITSIEDGCYNFSFDFSYFSQREEELERLDPEFKRKYEIFKKDNKQRWQELDSKKTICIKITDGLSPIPPFAGVFEEIYALYSYKDLQMHRTEMDNYLLLVASIGYMKNANEENAFQLGLDIAQDYYGLMLNNLPESVGAILSPFDKVEPITLKKSEKDLDTVSIAENAIYNAAGIPKLIFNSDKASGAALVKAIMHDQNTSFKILRQFERWVNRRLKDKSRKYYFKATFLDITSYNQKDIIDQYKESATYGLPVKNRLCASLGMTPSDTMNAILLENDILEINDKFIPLASSHTQTANNKGGNPGKDEGEVETSTDIGKDLDTNNPDNRVN